MQERCVALVAALALVGGGAASAEEPNGGYKPGKGFTWPTADGDNTINIGGRIQARYLYEDFDGARDLDDLSEFTAQRVRVHVKGQVFRDLKYKVQLDFGDFNAGDNLKDAYLTWARLPEAQVTAGQVKVRFDWQQYVSSGKQQFVDRNIASRFFGYSRDVGAMLSGEVADGKFEYNLGVWDGERTTDVQRSDGHAFIGRVSFQPLGAFGYSESDVKRIDDHRIFLNFAAALNDDLLGEDDFTVEGEGGVDLELEDVRTERDVDTYTVGFGWRHAGLSLQAEYFWRSTEETGRLSLEDPALDDVVTKRDAEGGYLQLGYVFPGSKWELAARYAIVDPDDSLPLDDRTESMIGLNRFFMGVGHSFKLSADAAWLETERSVFDEDLEKDVGEELDDFRFRLQAQIVF
jgi:hypothetical protein